MQAFFLAFIKIEKERFLVSFYGEKNNKLTYFDSKDPIFLQIKTN